MKGWIGQIAGRPMAGQSIYCTMMMSLSSSDTLECDSRRGWTSTATKPLLVFTSVRCPSTGKFVLRGGVAIYLSLTVAGMRAYR